MTQQAVTGLVPERLRLAGDHSHRAGPGPGRREEPFRAGRAGADRHRPRPSPASPPSPTAPPAGPATPTSSPALVLKPARTSITC
jgi:hypothetical protein